MTAIQDPSLRPVYVDRRNQRLFADPAGAGPWLEVQVGYGTLAAIQPYVVLGRGATSGTPQSLSPDVVIELLNTATSLVINSARVAAGSTTAAGVLQLTDSVSSTSTSTAATPNAVKTAYDLAGNALPKTGGTVTGDVVFATTTATQLPVGDTAQRPPGVPGKVRFNSALDRFEGYSNSVWGPLGGGATGGGSDKVFVETDQVATSDYTITTGKNAVSAGPVAIGTGVTVTVPSGSTWVVV